MSRFAVAVGLCCLFGAALAWSADDKKKDDKKADKDTDKKWIFIDIKAKTNQKLKEDFHGKQFPGNNLANLPQGEQTLEGIKFKIGDGLIQLTSMEEAVKDKPAKVKSIDYSTTKQTPSAPFCVAITAEK